MTIPDSLSAAAAAAAAIAGAAAAAAELTASQEEVLMDRDREMRKQLWSQSQSTLMNLSGGRKNGSAHSAAKMNFGY
jgi:hypothetical protein